MKNENTMSRCPEKKEGLQSDEAGETQRGRARRRRKGERSGEGEDIPIASFIFQFADGESLIERAGGRKPRFSNS